MHAWPDTAWIPDPACLIPHACLTTGLLIFDALAAESKPPSWQFMKAWWIDAAD